MSNYNNCVLISLLVWNVLMVIFSSTGISIGATFLIFSLNEYSNDKNDHWAIIISSSYM